VERGLSTSLSAACQCHCPRFILVLDRVAKDAPGGPYRARRTVG
jgi:hypothetical protein